jgi:hypothetical protein
MTLTTVSPGLLDSTAQYYGFKNRIINGAMVIDQRNAGASITFNDDVFPVDRWTTVATQSSKGTIQQNAGSVTPPAGFTNYLGFTSSSAYSVLTGDAFAIQQRLEGLNLSDFGWGSANAQTVNLSFWVRSSLTGTFGGVMSNSAQNRSYPFTYTITAANTWELETVTIPGDTSGTWLTTNGIGARLNLGLGAGATYSGTAGAWSGSTLFSATGAVSVVGTNGATFYITGVQLEKGSTATSFDYRPYTTELQLCQRYYQQWGGNTGNERLATGFNYSTTQMRIDIPLVVTMRTTPTLTVSAASDWAVEGPIVQTCTSINLDQASPRIASTNFNVVSGLTSGQGGHIMANGTTNARFNLSAEL